MINRSVWISLIVAALIVISLVPVSALAQDPDPAIQVGMVIVGADGQSQTQCVTLDQLAPTGADVLQATGLEVVLSTGSMGTNVCRIGADGCTPPDESCFCQCEDGPSCAYWSYFHLGEQGNWQYSPIGAGNYTVTHGAVEGWWWRDSADESAAGLPTVSFADICGDAFPRTVIDGLGREIVLDAPPQRIVSVTLGSDEILLDLVGPERLLGVTFFADNPLISNVAGQLTGIEHTDISGNPEVLISLDADLVIMASYSDPAAVDQLLDADVPVLVLTEFNTIDEIRANIRLLGAATGEEQRAERLIDNMDAQITNIQQQVAGYDPVRVLYYEPGGITYGPGSTIDQIITMVGGVNVIAEADLGAYPVINAEFVLASDPDVILLGTWYSDADDPLSWFTDDPIFSGLRAVQNGRIYAINDAHITNVSHYIALGVEDIAHILYPQVFVEAGP